MRTDKFSKTNLILYACGLIPVIWLGLLVAPYIDGGLVGGASLKAEFGQIVNYK